MLADLMHVNLPNQSWPLPEQVLCLHKLSGHPGGETRVDETEKKVCDGGNSK